jgi:pilus assembly protein Flp/PilA
MGATPERSHQVRDFMIRIAAQIRSRQEGQAMVEYALILGLVSVVAITMLGFIGTDVNTIFTKIEAALSAAAAG